MGKLKVFIYCDETPDILINLLQKYFLAGLAGCRGNQMVKNRKIYFISILQKQNIYAVFNMGSLQSVYMCNQTDFIPSKSV